MDGCNHHKRVLAGPAHVDKVGPLLITYKEIDQSAFDASYERRRRILASVARHLEVFEQDHDKFGRTFITDIYMGKTPADDPGYVPCATPNGGGCYTLDDQRIWITAGVCDDVPNLYHELYHAYLHTSVGDPTADANHTGPGWTLVRQRTKELRDELCVAYGLPLASTK